MENLILNSLEIRGFRGFRHLQIGRLGRVNLIVGKNNVGKSSLLEALQLYVHRGSPVLIWELLRTRDESRYPPSSRLVDTEDQLLALKYLFYGRKDVRDHLESIQIGPIGSLDDTFSISLDWYIAQVDEEGNRKMRLLQPEDYSTVDNPVPRFTVQMGKEPKTNYPINPSAAVNRMRAELKEINCISISANGLTREEVSNLWDNIALTSLEKDVLASLHIIAPGVEGLSIIGDSTMRRGDLPSALGRIPIVKIAGIDEPLPLRNLGDGMQRMLSIALALANAKDGMLLVDEIENGIHYSAQTELWQLVFRLAHRLNVQVFATTHNWDCIKGFQEAAQEDKKSEGLLIRLSVKKGEVNATLFDEEELGVATRQQIEVR